MTREEENCIRWCYVVAGLSRKRLARDFDIPISEVERIVSSGLGDVLRSDTTGPQTESRVYDMNSPIPQRPQTKSLNLELCRFALRAAFWHQEEVLSVLNDVKLGRGGA